MQNKTREERKRDRTTYSASVVLICFSLILILWCLHLLGGGLMRRKSYPVCEHCNTVMNQDLHEDVSPGFVVNTELYCSHCFKAYMDEELNWMQSILEKDPEAVAQTMGVLVRRFE